MTPQTPLRILVVDDEAPARRKILRLLREESAVEIAGEADGGEAAVAAIRKQHPDLVFSRCTDAGSGWLWSDSIAQSREGSASTSGLRHGT